MRIFLAGGSDVIGTRLIPALAAAGHDVTATTRRAETLDRLRALGATPVQVDVYDASALRTDLPEGQPAGTGALNTKARAEGWEPLHPSWRDGFAA